jgi:hypothetical protein
VPGFLFSRFTELPVGEISAMRVLALCSLLLMLASCMPRIPDHVLDADWCRSMEAAKAEADGRGRRNLEAAMTRHHCKEKLAEASGAS